MKIQNTRNQKIGEIIHDADGMKTVRFEDGTQSAISDATYRRWYRNLDSTTVEVGTSELPKSLADNNQAVAEAVEALPTSTEMVATTRTKKAREVKIYDLAIKNASDIIKDFMAFVAGDGFDMIGRQIYIAVKRNGKAFKILRKTHSLIVAINQDPNFELTYNGPLTWKRNKSQNNWIELYANTNEEMLILLEWVKTNF